MENSFIYRLNEKVKLTESEESGPVVARAEYTYMENQYLIRYKAGDGRMVESWWAESALEAAE